MLKNQDTTNYVCECNHAFNAETLHPLVTLIDMSVPCERKEIETDCYAIVFKRLSLCEGKFGRTHYDYSDGTLLFITPQKKMRLCTDKGKMLIFHPSLITCTPLGMRLREYTFFKYAPDEALHISSCEGKVIERCLANISAELCWGIDRYTKPIISNSIELLLNYCQRFYTRQFILRHDINVKLIAQADQLIDSHFTQGKAMHEGMPTLSDIADTLKLSPCYLEDMLHHESGSNMSQYIQLRRLSLAKQWLLGTDKTVEDIAETLGYSSRFCFTSIFKKVTGKTPEEYRK